MEEEDPKVVESIEGEEDPEVVASTEAPPLSPEQQQRAAEMVKRNKTVEADCAERLRLGIS